MKKLGMLFLLPLCCVSMSSCAPSFEMIDQGNHGEVVPHQLEATTKQSFMDKLEALETTITNDDANKYKDLGSDIYLTRHVEDEEGVITSIIASVSKDKYELKSEKSFKGDEIVQHIIFNDATNPNKMKVYFNKYSEINNEIKIEPYYAEEEIKQDNFEYLNDYYHTAHLSYYDNMYEMASAFMIVVLLAQLTETTPEAGTVDYYVGNADIQYGRNIISYVTVGIEINIDTDIASAELMIDDKGLPRYTKINTKDTKTNEVKNETVSLLPYEKNIRPLDDGARKVVLPNQVDKILYGAFSNK